MSISQQAKVNHLYWRAGFGLSPEEFQKYKDKTISSHLDMLFKGASKTVHKLQVGNLSTFTNLKDNPKGLNRKLIKDKGKALMPACNANWLRDMAAAHSSPLVEKMCLFWHGHFACQVKMPHLAVNYQYTLKKHTLGNFKDLLLGIAQDASMIRFLNNQQNRKQNPNENFAREVLELFTLGQGNLYSEQDIKEAARAFTGWTSKFNGEFYFRKEWHDFGSKTFMGKTGNFNGDEILDIVLEKKQTARFIASKVYRFFVNEQADPARIEELASVFYKANYNIKTLMRHLLEANWFYDAKNIGTKIKSPIDLIVGLMRQMNVHFLEDKSLIFLQKALGQTLYGPPNVAGWKGGESWIDNSSLLLRLNLGHSLFNSKEVQLKVKEEFEAKKRNPLSKKIEVTADLKPFIKIYSKLPRNKRLEAMQEYLIQTKNPVKETAIENFISQESEENHIASLILCLMSCPEYQMC